MRRIDDDHARAGQRAGGIEVAHPQVGAQDLLGQHIALGDQPLREADVEALRRPQVFERTPEHINTRRPALERVLRRLGHVRHFVGILEWRIDEHQPATLRRRDQRLERRVAVAVADRNARIGLVAQRQGARVRRVKLAENHAVLWTRQRREERGRTGIERQSGPGVVLGDDFQIGRKKLRRRRREARGVLPRVPQAANAVAPFRAAPRLFARKVVPAEPGVGVDGDERRVLARQIPRAVGGDGMLEHVGEISRVEGVAVIHEAWRP